MSTLRRGVDRAACNLLRVPTAQVGKLLSNFLPISRRPVPRGDRGVCEFGHWSASIAMMAKDAKPTRVRVILHRVWGRVRWKIAAIVVFTGTSAILIACLAVAALNVAVRRESANVVEKQIQVLVQASRSVASAILDHAGPCTSSLADSGGLKPLLAYTDEAFPQAQASLIVESPRGTQPLPPGPNAFLTSIRIGC
jgi:hypothetical protein